VVVDVRDLLLCADGKVDCVWNAMAHAQKPDFVFRRNGRVHLNRRGCQFSRVLAAEVCASTVAMLDTACCEVVWRVLATHSIRQFPLHLLSRASPCSITFQLDSTWLWPSVCLTAWSIRKSFWWIFVISYYDQQMHNSFTHDHTPTCFDTIVSSSGSL
jgi:hypothetical protein